LGSASAVEEDAKTFDELVHQLIELLDKKEHLLKRLAARKSKPVIYREGSGTPSFPRKQGPRPKLYPPPYKRGQLQEPLNFQNDFSKDTTGGWVFKFPDGDIRWPEDAAGFH
jgi:hypothetical protein